MWSAAAALAVYMGSLTLTNSDEPALKAEKDRKPAPEFSLKDSSGKTVKLSDYRGKVVLLNFWATWCPPCQTEIPWFVDFQKQYKDRGFAILGVSLDEEGWNAVRPYAARKNLNYEVMIGGEDVAQLYGGVNALPSTFIIDRQGRIANSHTGLAAKNTYQQEIVQLLGSPADDSYRSAVPAFSRGLLAFIRTN